MACTGEAFSSGDSSRSAALEEAAAARLNAEAVQDARWCGRPTLPCRCEPLARLCSRCRWQAAAPDTTCPGCWAEQQSRAATTIAALHKSQPGWDDKPTLHLAFVGVDQEECSSAEGFLTKQLSGLLLYLLRKSRVQLLCIHAAGPCCTWPNSESRFTCQIQGSEDGEAPFALALCSSSLTVESTNVYPLPALHQGDSQQISASSTGQLSVRVASCKVEWEKYDSVWRDSFERGSAEQTAMLVLPNAGLWGYDSWLPALDAMFVPGQFQQSVLTTSYTLAEAEDDAEVVDALGSAPTIQSEHSWGPECSPLGCIHLADPKYKVVNNYAWQCSTIAGSSSGRGHNEEKTVL